MAAEVGRAYGVAQPGQLLLGGIIVAVLSLAAVGLIAVGGGVVWYLSRPPPLPPVVVVPPAVEPEPIAEAEPVAPPEVPTPPVVEPTPTPTPPEGATADPVVKPKPTPAPITLTEKLVRVVMNKPSNKMPACGDQFRSELPADRRVRILLTIKNSGEVGEAKVTEPATVAPALAKCLEGRAKRVKFPPNKNAPEFAIQIPMKFNETN